MNKKKLIGLAIFAVVVIIAAIGYRVATRETAEEIAENAIEAATNGQADVDYSDDTITVNTNAGSYQAGERVSLPAGFPSDVYVIDGTLRAAVTNGTDGYNLTIETPQSPAEANAVYEREIRSEGWTITSSANYNGVYSIAAQKADRYLTFGSTTSEGKTAVMLTVYRQTMPSLEAPAN